MRRSFITAAVLVLMLGACGSTSGKASNLSPLTLIASAPERAAEAKTARFESEMDLPIEGRIGPVLAKGVVDFENGSVQLAMNVRDFAPDAPDQVIQVRLVDGTMYLGSGEMLTGSELPRSLRGKKWLRLNPSDLGLPDELFSQQQNNADWLQVLRGAGSVREIGPATVRGVQTTEYRAVVNVRKAFEQMGPDVAEQLEPTLSTFDSETYPVRVWIDDDGLPRRQLSSVSVEGKTVRMKMDYFDFGVGVQITAPLADETGDFSELIEASQRTSS